MRTGTLSRPPRRQDRKPAAGAPVWIASVCAAGLHLALLGGASRLGLPQQVPDATSLPMQTRWVSESARAALPQADAAAQRVMRTGPATATAATINPATTDPDASLGSSQPTARSKTTDANADADTKTDAGAFNHPRDGAHRLPRSAEVQRPDPRAFLAADQLDWPPMPYSAPDSRLLDGLDTSGLPLKARLLVDADGVVQDLLPLQPVLDQDQRWFAQVRTMFMQTRFTPGRLEGRAVAASLDLDIQADPELGLN